MLRAFTEKTPGVPVRDHVVLQAGDATYAIRSGDWKFIERTDAPTLEFKNQKQADKAAE